MSGLLEVQIVEREKGDYYIRGYTLIFLSCVLGAHMALVDLT